MRVMFFRDTGAGRIIGGAVDRLAYRFPKNKLIGRIWNFCLPC